MKVTNSKKAKKISGLQKLLQTHKGEFEQLENGKIKCILTGHEFMPSEENVLAHMSSKSYKKASEAQFDISQYEDVLETHKQGENFLFCRLTGAKVPKKKTAIQKHVNGKKFKTRFQQYKAQLEEEEEEELVDDNEENEQQEEGEDIEEQEEDEQVEQEEQEEQQQTPPAKNNSKKANGKHQQNGKKTQQHKKSAQEKHTNGHQKQKKIKKSRK